MDVFEEIQYHQIGSDPLSGKCYTHNDTYEILQVFSDGGTVLLNDNIYPLTRGSIYLIRGMLVHGTNPAIPESYCRNKVILKYSYIKHLFSLTELDAEGQETLESEGGYFPLTDEESKEADRLFFEIYESYLENSSYAKTEITGNLLQLLFLVFSFVKKKQPQPDLSSSRIGGILQYINERLTEELSLDQIAAAVGISKYYLCRLFRTKVGMTVLEYIAHRRLSLAKEKLIMTELSVAQIAFSAGFCNTSHFCRLFKQQEGMSPNTFRGKYSLKAMRKRN